MKYRFAKAVRTARTAGVAAVIGALATAAVAQTVPDQDVPGAAGLDLPANLQIFGKADPNIRKPNAIVNDSVITGTDVDQRLALTVALNNLNIPAEQLAQVRFQVLRQLIDETLQLQEADTQKIEVSSKEVDDTFKRVSASFKKTPEQMRAWLRDVGSSERSMRRQIQGELAWGRVLRRNGSVEVSDAEVQAILDRIKASKGTEEYHLFEIYLNATPERREEVVAAEQQIIEQLKKGTPFQAIAQSVSEATTRKNGGDLGWVRLVMLPEALAQATTQMEVGQIAGPIEVPGGFSLLYLADKRQIGAPDPRDAKLSLKQITITFPKGTTEAQATARASDFAKATSEMRGCGEAAKTAQTLGAEIVDNDAMRIKDLPPALQRMILDLQIGQSTRPFGSIDDGVRVLVLCGRDDPVDAGLPTPEQIAERISDDRTNLKAQRMLRDLRRDALIEYR